MISTEEAQLCVPTVANKAKAMKSALRTASKRQTAPVLAKRQNKRATAGTLPKCLGICLMETRKKMKNIAILSSLLKNTNAMISGCAGRQSNQTKFPLLTVA
jgi:hypothetical protein